MFRQLLPTGNHLGHAATAECVQAGQGKHRPVHARDYGTADDIHVPRYPDTGLLVSVPQLRLSVTERTFVHS